MKLVQIAFHFEFADMLEEIIDRHAVENFVRYPMIEGKDIQGKHYGSQVFPGNITVVQAQVADDKVEELLKDLREFRDSREVRKHLTALVLPVEQSL